MISFGRLHMFIVFFFFFQAEDGIRDLTVTGVQTCALPISFEWCGGFGFGFVGGGEAWWWLLTPQPASGATSAATRRTRAIMRSEERRVGKECRSRWSAYH